MYVGDHVDTKICPVCGNVLAGPTDGCSICWHGTDRGMLVSEDSRGALVHRHCLDFFGVDTIDEFERQYYDI